MIKALTVLTVAMVSSVLVGCGHYPAPIGSARDVGRVSPSEYMIVMVDLPLEDWPKLQKFRGLEHFQLAEGRPPQVTDQHVRALSRLELPKLRQVSLAYCRQVTDNGLQALTNIPSIQGFRLIDTSITDRGMFILATEFPNLKGINVEGCRLVSERGFLTLTNSRTINSVSLSLEMSSQEQIEHIISTVSNVTWWTISDVHHRLNEAPLRQIGESRKITIQVADENNYVRSITRGPQDGS
jgi:hypothetical protein